MQIKMSHPRVKDNAQNSVNLGSGIIYLPCDWDLTDERFYLF